MFWLVDYKLLKDFGTIIESNQFKNLKNQQQYV